LSRPARALPALLVAAHLVIVFGVLARTDRALATRDLPQFHLPLRASLATLAHEGVPGWNPFVQGGQPLLSDPSYSAFYPPTWLVLVAPPAHALGLIVLLHVALAGWGAYRLARRLGCRPATATLAASGFAGGGAFVSLVHAYTLLPGAAWLPWAIDAADRAAAAPTWRSAARPLAATAAVLAAVALNGEPATLLVAAAATVATASIRAPTRPLRAFAAGGAAFLLAAVQLLPALARLAGSARAGGLDWEQATRWSMSPLRLAELVLPRLLGDPARLDEGLYFGFGLHDLDYPYLLLVTPGLPLLVLGFAALLSSDVPRRALWGVLAAGGLLLALGRHAPGLALLFDAVPLLSSIRYPEKFFLLTYAALVFAGALGWERALAARERGERGVLDLPLALAAVAAALAALGASIALAAPERLEDFLAAHAGLRPTAERLARALTLYRRDMLASLGLASALVALLAALRFRRRGEPARLVAVAWLLLVGELVWLTSPLVATLPARELESPPPLAREVIDRGSFRLWSSADLDRRAELVLRDEYPPEERMLRSRIARLDPSSGVLWGLRYALSVDFALTLTPPARRARVELEHLWRDRKRTLVHRLLGAWSVDTIVVRRGPRELFEAARSGEDPPRPATLAANPHVLPWMRTVPVASLFPDGASALAAAAERDLDVARREYLVTGESDSEIRFDPAARVVAAEDDGSRLRCRVAARGPSLLVVASTYDSGWRAELDGRSLPVLESGLGYLAVPLPPGGGDVELAYVDPWLGPGVAISVVAVVGLALLAGLSFARRRRGRP